MHLAAIKSVLHTMETIDLLSGQGGQVLLGTERAEHMERNFKTESFVHPQKWKAVHILPCNSTFQNKTLKATSNATG